MNGRNLYYQDEMIEKKFSMRMLGSLLSYGKKYKKTYFMVFGFLILNSILGVIPTTLNMIIINKVLPTPEGVLQDNYQMIALMVIIGWASVMVGQVIVSYINNRVTLRLGNSIVCELRSDMYETLMHLSFEYYDSRPTGKILVRITSYCDEVSDIFINHLTNIVTNIFMMVFSLICVCMIHAKLALTVLVFEIPMIIIVICLIRGVQMATRKVRNKNSNRTAFVAEDISGIDVIRAFNRAELNGEIEDELTDRSMDAFMKATHFREAVFPMTHGVVRILCMIVIYGTALYIALHQGVSGEDLGIFGRFLVGDGSHLLKLGVVVSVATYMQQFAEAVYNLCMRLENITTLTTDLERIFEVLYEKPSIQEKEDAYELPKVEGTVEYRDVTFGYNEETTVLEHLSFLAKPGEMIALVGPTGGGKTTIVSLLSRFYDVNEGGIYVDGHNIKDVTLKSLRGQICTMMQDTFLFSREIIENIRFSRPEATDEECIAAAKAVFADDFIRRMPEGYHTVLEKQGEGISGGQRQLLSFARMILADPKIIILDEATSNIDTETEALIQGMLKTVLKGRTSFVIAHRLSTIKNADRILFIDDKGIAESGTHDELMALKGKYYRLVNGQGH